MVRIKLGNTTRYINNINLCVENETCSLEGKFVLNSTGDIIGELSQESKNRLEKETIKSIKLLSKNDSEVYIVVNFLNEALTHSISENENINETKTVKKKHSTFYYVGMFFVYILFWPFMICKNYVKKHNGNKALYILGVLATLVWLSIAGPSETETSTNTDSAQQTVQEVESSEKTNNTQEEIKNTSTEKTEKVELTEEEKKQKEFIDSCQEELNYSNPKESFGEVYDIFANKMKCKHFSYSGRAKSACLDMIVVFVGTDYEEGLLFGNWQGYNIKVAFENEKISYIIFDETMVYEDGEVFKDYSYFVDYYNNHNIDIEQEAQIKIWCEEALESNLLIPKSAKYSNTTLVRNGNLYLYTGVVESQNAFGTMIPNEFIVEITGHGEIVYLQLGDEKTGEYVPLNE